MRLRYIILMLSAIVMAGLPGGSFCAKESAKIRFGTLPVLQALPIYVAQDKGLFAKVGIDVDVILFNTAAEKDIALTNRKHRWNTSAI